jgi:hypothetical protein
LVEQAGTLMAPSLCATFQLMQVLRAYFFGYFWIPRPGGREN